MIITNPWIRSRISSGAGANFILEPFTGQHSKTDNFLINAMLHTVDHDIPVFYTNGIRIIRNYIKNYADVITITCAISFTDYARKIYPNKENLELTLSKERIAPFSTEVTPGTGRIVEYYKAVLDPTTNMPISDSYFSKTPNRDEVIEVNFQLIELSSEILKNKIARGCYNYHDNKALTPKQLIEAVVKSQTEGVEVMGQPVIDAIDVAKTSNEGLIRNLLIPDSVKIYDVADYLQVNGGGLYSEGAGLYMQRYMDKKTLFVYPIYRTTKRAYDECEYRKADIVLTNSLDMVADKSTMSNDLFIKFVGYGTIEPANFTTTRELSKQTGFTSMDPELISSYDTKRVYETGLIPPVSRKPFVVKLQDGKVKMLHSSLLANRVTNVEREDSVEVVESSIQHSDNIFNRAAQLVKNRVETIEVRWPNALLYDVYPGMPCRIRYFVDGTNVKEVYGSLVGIEYILTKDGKTNISKEFKTSAVAFIAVDISQFDKDILDEGQ
jgi:hypothetical protein